MPYLTAPVLSQSCRIFLEQAYPRGPASIPASRLAFWMIPDDADVDDFLPPSPLAAGVARQLFGPHPGYTLGLGCDGFPFLRLTLQCVEHLDQVRCLCSVDTHDTWHHPEHRDATAWLARQAANRELKSRIEHAWEAAGLLTQNGLLRLQLQRAAR